jgi:hypothetical protein
MRLTDSLIRWGRVAVKGDPSCSCCTTEEQSTDEARAADAEADAERTEPAAES